MKRFLAVIAFTVGLAVPVSAQTRSIFYETCQPLFCVNATINAVLTLGVPPWLEGAGGADPIWYYEGGWYLGETGVTWYRLNSERPSGTGDQFFSRTLAESYPEAAAGRATFATDFIPAPSLNANFDTCQQPIGGRTCGPTSETYFLTLDLVSVTTTPEPGTMLLLATGFLGLVIRRSSHRKNERAS